MDLRNLAFRVDVDGSSAAIKEMDGATNKLKDAAEKTTSKLKWKCVKANAELPPVWQSEEQFFNWINVKMLHPSQRVV